MCIVAIKHFDDVGWVGIKNRDRNYKPVVNIKQSFRRDIERLFLLDEKTKYTEGLNEKGVCVLSAALATVKDEKEGTKVSERENFASPDGKKIRTALFEKSVDAVLKSLTEQELCGCTVVYDKDRAYLLEGARNRNGDYVNESQEIPKNETAIRTNHGIWIPWAGYQKIEGDEEQSFSRQSSESRYSKVAEDIEKIEDYRDMLDCISNAENEDPQLNPLRLDRKRRALTTTGQIMLVPSEMTMYYRPIWCNMKFNFDKLDKNKSKTYFQVLSARCVLKDSYKKITEFIK